MMSRYLPIKLINLAQTLLYITLFLSSCTEKDSQNREHLVFRYNEHSNITSLDPAFAKDIRNIWGCNQLYNGLTQLDDSLQVQPDIATSWEVSDNGLQYTFQLRSDVYFHKSELFGSDSTRSVTAQDFVYSLERLRDPEIASPGGWILKNVNHITAKNPHTLTIVLKKPFPAFLGLLSMKFCSVVPKEVITHYKNTFRSHPIGTGPFKFQHWEENIKLVFRKNELYYEKDKHGVPLPYLEAVAITFLPDKQSELLQFVQGNIDFLNSLDPSYKDELLTPIGKLRDKYTEQINMITAPYLNTEYLGIFLDSKTPEIQSIALRKAINYGFDRKKMITYLRNGIGTPANNGFIPKGLPGFNAQKGYDYQPKIAKQLVDKYKKETKNQAPKITISTGGQYLDICEYIQRELQKIGFSVAIDVMPPSTLRKQRSAGNLDIFRSSWVADYPDAENYLSLFYSKNFTPNGPNYTHFKDLNYDTWYEEALTITDQHKRIIHYQKMDSLLIQKAPIIPLYYDQVVRFTQKNVFGLGINAINLLDLRRVQKSKKQAKH